MVIGIALVDFPSWYEEKPVTLALTIIEKETVVTHS